MKGQEKERLHANEVKHGPDNFMGQDLARLVQERYPRALPTAGISLAELERMNPLDLRIPVAGVACETPGRPGWIPYLARRLSHHHAAPS